MIFFSEIKTDSAQYAFVEDLFLSAFPEEERRRVEDQRENIDFNPFLHCLLITDDEDTPLGFLTFWRFRGFTYVEHFAIAPEYRCQGVGAMAISTFVQMQNRPVILEAELPTAGPLAMRRIEFYSRCGFSQLDYAYIQPPYPGNEKMEGLPMVLMVFAQDISSCSPQAMQKYIYKEVYGVSLP